MERQLALPRGKPDREDRLSNLQALMLARSGRLADARESARQAIEFASAAGNPERRPPIEPHEELLGLWQDADAANSVVTQAHTEYGRLP
jgi:hypothetical protein